MSRMEKRERKMLALRYGNAVNTNFRRRRIFYGRGGSQDMVISAMRNTFNGI